MKAQAQLDRLAEQIDDLSLAAQGTDRAAAGARRRLLAAQERADMLAAEMEAQAALEKTLWADLWATPQAVAWERLRWTRDVAQYVRWKARAELGDLDASKEARQLSDRLGLSPLALLRLRWEISGDEVGELRIERTAQVSPSKRRRGLKAVDASGA